MMRQILYALSLFVVALCAPACGEQSQASLDCEEYSRLMEHLTNHLNVPLAATQIPNCEQRLVKTSTRCQGAFHALVQCSRLYHSKPDIENKECLSEFVEQTTSCTKPPAS